MEQQKMINGAAIASHDDKANEKRIQEKERVDPEGLSDDELRILKTIRARQMLRSEDTMSIDNFSSDNINGWAPYLKRGSLTLVKSDKPRQDMELGKKTGFETRDFKEDQESKKTGGFDFGDAHYDAVDAEKAAVENATGATATATAATAWVTVVGSWGCEKIV